MVEEVIGDRISHDNKSSNFPSQEIASAVHMNPSNIRFITPVDEDTAHFWFGYTQQSDGRAGFFKMVKDARENIRLQRESQAMQIAQRIGIPTVDILSPYQETVQRRGLLHLAKLDTTQGTLLKTDTDVESANPSLGARAARAILNIKGKAIPKDMDSSLLERDDWRFYDEHTFWSVWEQISDDVLANPITQKIVDTKKLRQIIEATQKAATPLVGSVRVIATHPDEYFIHRDVNLKNMFFPNNNDSPVFFLDFEDAGVSTNKVLAQITDIANFYARCAYNLPLQREFIRTFARESTKDTNTDWQTILKTSIVFGTLFLAPWILKEGHPELPLEKKLLANLVSNFRVVDDTLESANTDYNSKDRIQL